MILIGYYFRGVSILPQSRRTRLNSKHLRRKNVGIVQRFEKFVKSKGKTFERKQKAKARNLDGIEDEVDEISDIFGHSIGDFRHCQYSTFKMDDNRKSQE